MHKGNPEFTDLARQRAGLSRLPWTALVELTAAPRTNPVLRRDAERILGRRLSELALGERVSLARRAVRALLPSLAAGGEPAVTRALLGNPRLVENDVIEWAGDEEASADVLREIAHHPVWGTRRRVRFALAANPRTPAGTALGVAKTLEPSDLQLLSRDATVPTIIRIAADRWGASSPPATRSAGRP